MDFSIKDLLKDAINRANLGPQMLATQIVEATNGYLDRELPSGRTEDARAISFREDCVYIGCKNGAVAQFLDARRDALLEEIARAIPDSPATRIRTKIVSHFERPDMLE